MSASHVIYACHCLNVKVHLANKYYLEGHEKFRKEKFVRLSDLPISGWQFELSTEGVKVQYASLIRTTRRSSKHSEWITFSCQNCDTGDVYSVKHPDEEVKSSEHHHSSSQQSKSKTSSPSSELDQPIVIIHTKTIFGTEIDKVEEKSNYSHTFHIVLKPDLPGSQMSLEEHDGANEDGELRAQHRRIQQLLKESLIDLEMATKKRVESYKAEQELLLRRAKEKAMYDGAILWQTIKEATRTVRDKERTRRLTLSSQQSLSKQQDKGMSIGNLSTFQLLPESKHPQPTSSSSSRSSIMKASGYCTDLFEKKMTSTSHSDNQGPQYTGTMRRASYILDESAIADSFRRNSKTVVTTTPQQQQQPELAMPQFYRRRSSLAPTPLHPYRTGTTATATTVTANGLHNSTQPSSSMFNNDFVHPLTQITTYTATKVPQQSALSDPLLSSRATKNGKEDDKEHVFSLDEEHPNSDRNEFSTGSVNKNTTRRAPFADKYIESDEDDAYASQEDDDRNKGSKFKDQNLAPRESEEERFATSVPIDIQGPHRQASYSLSHASPSSSSYRDPNAPIITIDNEKLSLATSSSRTGQSIEEQLRQLRQLKQHKNINEEQQQGNDSRRRSSVFGIDYTAEADRRASLMIIEESSKLPPHLREKNRRRRHSSAWNTGTASTTAALHNQPHYYTQSMETHQQQRRSSMSFTKHGDRDQDDMLGPIIPPHILAANTYTDEAEAMFGSVPRNSTRHRPLE